MLRRTAQKARTRSYSCYTAKASMDYELCSLERLRIKIVFALQTIIITITDPPSQRPKVTTARGAADGGWQAWPSR